MLNLTFIDISINESNSSGNHTTYI